MNKVYTVRCRRCHGSGRVLNHHRTGAALRKARIARGLTLRQMARQLGLSAPYLCNLEYGLRSWSRDLLRRFRAALKS